MFIRTQMLYHCSTKYTISLLVPGGGWTLLAEGISEQERDGTEFHLVPGSKQPQDLYDIYLMLYVQS